MLRGRAPSDRRRRHRGVHAVFDEFAANAREGFDAHVKGETGELCERGPIEIGSCGGAGRARASLWIFVLVFLFVACDEGEAGIEIAMGDGDSGIRRRCNGRRNSRDHLKWDPRGVKRFAFLAAAPEDERIAAFQAHDFAAEAGLRDQ